MKSFSQQLKEAINASNAETAIDKILEVAEDAPNLFEEHFSTLTGVDKEFYTDIYTTAGKKFHDDVVENVQDVMDLLYEAIKAKDPSTNNLKLLKSTKVAKPVYKPQAIGSLGDEPRERLTIILDDSISHIADGLERIISELKSIVKIDSDLAEELDTSLIEDALKFFNEKHNEVSSDVDSMFSE